jgi:hypothetical protein
MLLKVPSRRQRTVYAANKTADKYTKVWMAKEVQTALADANLGWRSQGGLCLGLQQMH